jgi:methylated-DNA-[protein]-cysteine S-methyltransferase
MLRLSVHSPLGPLTIVEDDDAIVALEWGWTRDVSETGLLGLAGDQLASYFGGDLTNFSLPLAPSGTSFQRQVWASMTRIPYGKTLSYGGVAEEIDSSPRAVGTACGRNPIPIIIPCHRVVGNGGALVGYSGGEGVETKRYLLAHESRQQSMAI